MCTSWADPTPRRLQLPESKVMTFQLLSKDGSSLDDAEVLSGRWQAYVEGFVSEAETPGVAVIKVRRPFLRRSVHNLVPPPTSLIIAPGLYLPRPWQGKDTTFTPAAAWRSRCAYGRTGCFTSHEPKTSYGVYLPARNKSARIRGSPRGTLPDGVGLTSSRSEAGVLHQRQRCRRL
jgi:hypothetical protein